MKNKKLIILLILLFPACFKLILDFATVNSRKLPYFGPKKFFSKIRDPNALRLGMLYRMVKIFFRKNIVEGKKSRMHAEETEIPEKIKFF